MYMYISIPIYIYIYTGPLPSYIGTLYRGDVYSDMGLTASEHALVCQHATT